jgi:N-acetylneuraminate synthase
MFISYAKGVRTWERHVDINYNAVPVSNYCSLPEQADQWFKSFHKAKEMCGGSSSERRVIPEDEIRYLDALVRGIYAKRSLPAGYKIDSTTFSQDFKLAVPLRKGQLSTREVINGLELTKDVAANQALSIDDVNGPYNEIPSLKNQILDRGV